MRVPKLWIVSVFENERPHALEIYDAVTDLFARLASNPMVEVRWSDRADSLPTRERMQAAVESRKSYGRSSADDGGGRASALKPPPPEDFSLIGGDGSGALDGPPDTKVEAGFAWEAFEDQILIVDLKMPPASRFAPYGHYGGMDVLEAAALRDCLYRVFVCSQEIENISQSYPHIHERLEVMKAAGLTLFTKTNGSKDLCDRIYSFIDLDRARYWMDPGTRNKLFEISRSSHAASTDSVLILGESGTGKEHAAKHIARIGHWLRDGRESEKEMETVHCGALLSQLARDELFGHVRGAYTGADTHELGHILRALGCNLKRPGRAGLAEDRNVDEFIKKIQSLDEILKHAKNTGNHTLAATNAKDTVFATNEFLLTQAKLIAAAERRSNSAREHVGYAKQFREWLLAGTPFLEPVIADDDECFDLRLKEGSPYGTVFLDEFADLSRTAQALILRLIQDGEVRPQGYPGSIRLKDGDNHHIRFIGATNKQDIEDALSVSAGPKHIADPIVREDLLYRIAGWIIKLQELKPDEIAIRSGPRSEGTKSTGIALEPGILIRYEEESCNIRGEWSQGSLSLLREKADEGLLHGHRRQVRTIIRRALRLAKVRPTTGIYPLGKREDTDNSRRWPVSEEIVGVAINPITPKPPTLAPPPSASIHDPTAGSSSLDASDLRDIFRKRRFPLVDTGVNEKRDGPEEVLWADCPPELQKNSKGKPSLWKTATSRFGGPSDEGFERVLCLLIASIYCLPDRLSTRKKVAELWGTDPAMVSGWLPDQIEKAKKPELLKSCFVKVTGASLKSEKGAFDQIRAAAFNAQAR